MKRCIWPFLFAGLFMACCARASNVVWNNLSGGNWSTTANWTPHRTPGANDIAVITNAGNYTVTLDVSPTVNGLVLGTASGSTQILSINGQTLTLDGLATVNSGGQFNLSSGTFNGATNGGGAKFSGTLAPSGGALAGKLTMASNSLLRLVGNSASNALSGLLLLTNYGTVTWSNTDLYGASGLQIFNSGLWDAQADSTSYGSGMVFNSSGTFRKSAGGGTTTLDKDTIFNSTGTLEVQSGTLAIQAGNCSGIFNTASSTILNFGYNSNLITFSLTGNCTFTGSGIVEGIEVSGNNALIGGTVTFSAATLYNIMTISNTGIVNFVGTLGSNTLGAVTFNNYGVVNLSNTDLRIGAGSATAQINNYGLWDAKDNNTLRGTDSFHSFFYNYGIFRKSIGAGTTTLDSKLAFRNAGTVDVQSGTLEIQYGYGISNGTFNIATNALTYFSDGVYGFSSYGGTIFTGSGNLLGNLTGASGGSNVVNGTITYLGGTVRGSLTVASNAVLNLPAGASFSIPGYAKLANYGIVNWISGDLSGSGGGGIDNYGLWDAKTNNTFYGGNSVNKTTFNNYGAFRKSAGSDFSYLDDYVTFNNFGVVENQAGALGISSGTGSGAFFIATNSALVFSGSNPYVLTGNPIFTGDGFVRGNLTGSNAVLSGTINTPRLILSGSHTLASNATLNLTQRGYPPMTFNGTLFTNYGTVNWGNNDFNGQSSPQIVNYGLWDAQANNTFDGGISGGTTIFKNHGTFRKSGGTLDSGASSLDNNTTFSNSGTVDIQTGVLIFSHISESGVVNLASNTAFYSPACNLTGSPTFNGSGFVQGNLNGSNAVLNGSLTLSFAFLSGSLTVASNALVNLTQPVIFTALVLTNYGTVNWNDADLSAVSAVQVYNYGLWDAKMNNTFNGEDMVFNNYGTFRKSGGTIDSGTSSLENNITFNNSGTMDLQLGQMVFAGSCALTGGTLNFGINNSNNFGSIHFANDAAVAGTLSVVLNTNYSPGTGSSFALLSYGSETGVFTAMNLPHLSGLIWQTNYGAKTFTLSVTDVPPPQLSPVATQNGGMISFSWDSLLGQTYQIQYTTNLAPVNWENLGNTLAGTNGLMTASDVIGMNPQRFYRVVVLP